jgi:hypothetical protein
LNKQIIDELNLKSTFDGEKLTQDELNDSVELINFAYNKMFFPYFAQLLNWRKKGFKTEAKGKSTYKITDGKLVECYDRMFAIAEDNKASFFAREITFEWVNAYGLYLDEAKQAAADCLAEMLKVMESAGLLTDDFFSPEIFDVVAEDILHQIHIEYFGDDKTKAKYGPFKGRNVLLSDVISGKEYLTYNTDEAVEKIRELGIQTNFGYNLFLNFVFSGGYSLPGTISVMDIPRARRIFKQLKMVFSHQEEEMPNYLKEANRYKKIWDDMRIFMDSIFEYEKDEKYLKVKDHQIKGRSKNKINMSIPAISQKIINDLPTFPTELLDKNLRGLLQEQKNVAIITILF